MKLHLDKRQVADIELSLLDIIKLVFIGKVSMQGYIVRFWHYSENLLKDN